MPPKKNSDKPQQQLTKTALAVEVSNVANKDQSEANVNMPSNSDILGAIRTLRDDFAKQSVDLLEAVNGIKGDLLSQSRRIGEAEERISQAEEDVITLQQRVKQLEQTAKMLRNKVQDQEDRGRRSNLRLIGLPEKTEGSDMCNFLENWVPTALGDTFTSAPVIERAHRVGQVTSSRSSAPRPIIMKFLNYKDREKTLRAARSQKEVRYGNQRVSFFPDLSAETRQRQRQFDGVKARFRSTNIRNRLLHPAHLVITHDGQRLIFKSVAEAEDFLRGLQTTSQGSQKIESPAT